MRSLLSAVPESGAGAAAAAAAAGVEVLEIFKDGSELAVSLFADGDYSAAVRRYVRTAPDFAELRRLTQETAELLDEAAERGGILSRDRFRELKKAGQLLWDSLIPAQLKDELSSRGRILVLFIDEELVFLPWELLYDGNDFFCLKHTVGRLVRARAGGVAAPAPAPGRALERSLRMLVLADPTNDLAAAYEEGLQIKNQLGRRGGCVEVDFKASAVEKVYVKKNIRDYDVVHFAGHCEDDPADRSNAGWLLKDGRFTGHDVIAMNQSAPLPALIFSNACRSARVRENDGGQDQLCGNYGLASAFLFSGVRHYLGAVRRIEDNAGRHFAEAFYENLAGGNSVGESVRLSRLRVIGTYGREAVLWAGYVLYGNPADRLLPATAGAACAPGGKGFPAVTASRWVHRYASPCAAAAAALTLGGWFAAAAPTRQPDAYFHFVRGKQYFARGDNAAALKEGERAVARDARFLQAYPLVADAYVRLGSKDKALQWYYDYYLQSEKKADVRHRAAAYAGLGWSYHLAGNFRRADEFYSKALELSVRNRDKLNEAVALRRLAVLRTDQKRNDEALALLTKSSELNRQFPRSYEHRYNLACDYFDIGLVFANKDDYAAARDFYTKSRALFEQLQCRRELSDCHFNLGELYLYEKQYRKAMEHYERGLAIDLRHNDRFNLVTDYSMIGELHAEMEAYPAAEEAYHASIALARETQSAPEEAYSLHQLGRVYKKTGRGDKAREAFSSARELYRGLDREKYEELGRELEDLNLPEKE